MDVVRMIEPVRLATPVANLVTHPTPSSHRDTP